MTTANAKTSKPQLKGKILGVDLSRVIEREVRESFKDATGKDAPEDLTDAVRTLAQHFADTAKASKEGQKEIAKGGSGLETLLECESCGGFSTPDYDRCPFCGAVDEGDDEKPGEPVADVAPPAIKTAGNGAPSALAGKAPPPEPVPRTERELDSRLQRVREISARGAHEAWKLGKELRVIYEEDLWRQRNDDNGAPIYKTFDAFLRAEVHLAPPTVMRLMRTTKEYTEHQLASHGMDVLRGLLSAPKDVRTAVLADVEAGKVKPTRAAVEREAARHREGREAKVEKGVGKGKGRGVGAAKASEAAAKARAEKKKNTITVPFPVGMVSVEAWARPTKKGEAPRRAKKLGDRPHGELELSNGVMLKVAIVESAAGGLKFQLSAHRKDD